MDTITILRKRLDQFSKEFNFLLQENKELKLKLEQFRDKNDIYTKNSQDLILTIHNKLKEEK
jgi:hypothetical protein